MKTDHTPIAEPPKNPGTLRRMLGGSCLAVALLAAATLAVVWGTYAGALAAGAESTLALTACLAAAVAWVCIACPAAAIADNAYAALVRAAVPADAAAIALIVLWPLARDARGLPSLTFAAVAEIYLVLAAVALFSAAAVRLGRRRSTRLALAAVVSLLLAAACTSPFWTGGLVAAGDPHQAGNVLDAILWANPFYGATAATVEQTRFLWYEHGLMYTRFTSFLPYPMPPLTWRLPVIFYGALALVLAVVNRLIPRKK